MPVNALGENLTIPHEMENRLEKMASRRISRVQEAFNCGTLTLDEALKAAYLQGMADMGHAATLGT